MTRWVTLCLPILRLCLLAFLLPGCKLIDQRTFQAKAVGPQPGDIDRSKLAPLPFVTIDMSNPDADFRPQLAEAVEAAQARKPDVEFDVLAPIPSTASQDVQDRFTENGKTDTQAVASALGYDGVSMDKVHVGFHGDPGSPPRAVRIYLR